MFDANKFAARLAERKDRWALLKDFVAYSNETLPTKWLQYQWSK